MAIFIPTYFSPISQYATLVKEDEIVFEVSDNFQKQTYRNRCYIYSPNGKLLLNIPIQHNKATASKDILIDNSVNWKKQHLKSLETAYKSSPFFEFYIDDLKPIFEKEQKFLMDLNLQCHALIMDALQVEIPSSFPSEYEKDARHDFRYLAIAKQKLAVHFPRYIQVFEDKHGFLPNLSILDLLFMEGPSAINYLLKIQRPAH